MPHQLEIVTTVAEMQERARAWRRAGLAIGAVPTMGALHEGHLSLVRRARAENDRVVVTIFVNPLQFGPNEDYNRYPRDLDGDAALVASTGADVIFAPPVNEMYPEPPLTSVDVAGISEGLCGASRPGHFRGVATVVSKLLHITLPDRAYFGQKDAQQLAVIRRMVRDLNFPVAVIGCPVVREADGLAMSSRNRYLGPAERQAATVLSRALRHAAGLVAGGVRDADQLRSAMREMTAAEPLARLDYADVVDAETIQPLTQLSPGRPALLALAVRIGTTRLIDNLEVLP